MQQFFEYSTEVQQAIHQQRPIVALESTVITHGLPYPINIETAIALEEMLRAKNVVPATIAIIKGKIKIGLSLSELETLVNDKNVAKASRRDLSYILSKKLNAGTTVAATLFCAALAGIKIFATGGIGGVHRGDEQDISADLIELAKTPVAVICAGAKAILDLPKTLEFLETHSIPIVGFGTDKLPAFYSASSHHMLPARVDDIESLVSLLTIHWQLGGAGVLVTNPIPAHSEIPADSIEPVIADALTLAEQKKISGKAITPFLLNEVANITKGKSIQANIALLKNNITLGARLACALQHATVFTNQDGVVPIKEKVC